MNDFLDTKEGTNKFGKKRMLVCLYESELKTQQSGDERASLCYSQNKEYRF